MITKFERASTLFSKADKAERAANFLLRPASSAFGRRVIVIDGKNKQLSQKNEKGSNLNKALFFLFLPFSGTMTAAGLLSRKISSSYKKTKSLLHTSSSTLTKKSKSTSLHESPKDSLSAPQNEILSEDFLKNVLLESIQNKVHPLKAIQNIASGNTQIEKTIENNILWKDLFSTHFGLGRLDSPEEVQCWKDKFIQIYDLDERIYSLNLHKNSFKLSSIGMDTQNDLSSFYLFLIFCNLVYEKQYKEAEEWIHLNSSDLSDNFIDLCSYLLSIRLSRLERAKLEPELSAWSHMFGPPENIENYIFFFFNLTSKPENLVEIKKQIPFVKTVWSIKKIEKIKILGVLFEKFPNLISSHILSSLQILNYLQITAGIPQEFKGLPWEKIKSLPGTHIAAIFSGLKWLGRAGYNQNKIESNMILEMIHNGEIPLEGFLSLDPKKIEFLLQNDEHIKEIIDDFMPWNYLASSNHEALEWLIKQWDESFKNKIKTIVPEKISYENFFQTSNCQPFYKYWERLTLLIPKVIPNQISWNTLLQIPSDNIRYILDILEVDQCVPRIIPQIIPSEFLSKLSDSEFIYFSGKIPSLLEHIEQNKITWDELRAMGPEKTIKVICDFNNYMMIRNKIGETGLINLEDLMLLNPEQLSATLSSKTFYKEKALNFIRFLELIKESPDLKKMGFSWDTWLQLDSKWMENFLYHFHENYEKIFLAIVPHILSWEEFTKLNPTVLYFFRFLPDLTIKFFPTIIPRLITPEETKSLSNDQVWRLLFIKPDHTSYFKLDPDLSIAYLSKLITFLSKNEFLFLDLLSLSSQSFRIMIQELPLFFEMLENGTFTLQDLKSVDKKIALKIFCNLKRVAFLIQKGLGKEKIMELNSAQFESFIKQGSEVSLNEISNFPWDKLKELRGDQLAVVLEFSTRFNQMIEKIEWEQFLQLTPQEIKIFLRENIFAYQTKINFKTSSSIIPKSIAINAFKKLPPTIKSAIQEDPEKILAVVPRMMASLSFYKLSEARKMALLELPHSSPNVKA